MKEFSPSDIRQSSWFQFERPLPIGEQGAEFIPDEFNQDTCLDCGTKSKVIFDNKNERCLTCIRCGWIEPCEDLNDITSRDEIYKFDNKPDEPESRNFSIVFSREAGCSGLIKKSSMHQIARHGFESIVDCSKQFCPSCNSPSIKGSGFYVNRHMRVQRFKCNKCGTGFSDKGMRKIEIGNLQFDFNFSRLSIPQIKNIGNLLTQGFSGRAVSRLSKTDKQTVWNIKNEMKKQGGTKMLSLCKCGRPHIPKHWCSDILENSPKRLDWLKSISPKWRGRITY